VLLPGLCTSTLTNPGTAESRYSNRRTFGDYL
jgi:hypothetical protein